jgi:hypothetical protein
VDMASPHLLNGLVCACTVCQHSALAPWALTARWWRQHRDVSLCVFVFVCLCVCVCLWARARVVYVCVCQCVRACVCTQQSCRWCQETAAAETNAMTLDMSTQVLNQHWNFN